MKGTLTLKCPKCGEDVLALFYYLHTSWEPPLAGSPMCCQACLAKLRLNLTTPGVDTSRIVKELRDG